MGSKNIFYLCSPFGMNGVERERVRRKRGVGGRLKELVRKREGKEKKNKKIFFSCR